MKKQFLKYTLLVAALVIAMPVKAFWGSVKSVQGSGVAKTETRAITAYEKIVVSGTVNLKITTEPTVSLQITGDDNILPLIDTTVKDGVLHITSKNNTSYSPKLNLVIHTTTPNLVAVNSSGMSHVTVESEKLATIEASGTGSVVATAVNTPKIVVKNSGTSEVTLVGTTEQLVANVTGTGNLNAKKLKSQNADVSVTGTADAFVTVFGEFKAIATGTGDIVYAGNPKAIEQNATGLGKIQHE